MKSKTSYFNKTIFWKNVTLYWPIWGIYSFILLCAMPILFVLSCNDGYRITPLSSAQKFEYLCDILEMTSFFIIITACAAVLIGMALYSYLYNSKSANMIHSLPVDRRELYGTNVISGIAFLAVPQVVVFLITVLICLAEGVTQVEYLAIWLLVMLATDVIAFSVVTFCAMFTGLLVAVPIYVVVVNCLAYVVNFLLEMVTGCFGYGVDVYNRITDSVLVWLSPIVCYTSKVQMVTNYMDGELQSMSLEGVHCILIYLALALVLYALAYVVYQKRQIEHAGELITVGFVKPIFRWGVGTIAAMYGSILVRAIFIEFGIQINLFVFVLLLLFIGMVAYFIADMFVRKTFHVFKKQNWKGCGLFSIILLLSFSGLYINAEYQEHRLPEIEDVECAFVDLGYATRYDGEDIQKVIDIHEKVLKNLSYYEQMDPSYGGYRYITDSIYVDYEYISIHYAMKNGELLSRSYRIPREGDGQEIIDTIIAVEKEPKNYLKNTLCNNYEEITEFVDGWVEFQGYSNMGELEYYSQDLTNAQMQKIYQAIIADTMEGNLIKYNSYYYGDSKYEEVYKSAMTYYIRFDYVVPKGGKANGYWDYYYAYMYPNYQMPEETTESVGFSFGKDCVNIINALYECGVIKEGMEIFWEYDEVWYENATVRFLYYALGCDYQTITDFEVAGVSFDRFETDDAGEKVYMNEYAVLTEAQCSQLFYAMIGDAKDEVLFKYNPSYLDWDEYYEGEDSVFSLYMDYIHPETGEYRTAEIMFGSDCQYIIEELVHVGIVESAEDICWNLDDTY